MVMDADVDRRLALVGGEIDLDRNDRHYFVISLHEIAVLVGLRVK